MTTRRAAVALLALGTAAARLTAQQGPKVPRVGLLIGGSAESSGHLVQAFFAGMAELGYQDGRNIRFELRYGDGNREKTERNARDLVASGVDLILAPSTMSVASARKATVSLPVVFSLVSDPVASGFVQSLARPGTNATGLSLTGTETGAKRVEILKETFPRILRIGVLHNPRDSASAPQIPSIRQGAQALGRELMVVEASAPDEFAAAVAKLSAWGAQALFILDTTLFFANRRTLVNLAAKQRWVTIGATKEYAQIGAVIAYGTDYSDNSRRSAAYVVKILKGAKPADLPVQQASKFEFVVNLKAARAVGLTVPQSVLLQATEVIQ